MKEHIICKYKHNISSNFLTSKSVSHSAYSEVWISLQEKLLSIRHLRWKILESYLEGAVDEYRRKNYNP